MIIRSYRQKASERLNFNNTVQAKRSAVAENLHTTGVSERRDIVRIPIADSHFLYIYLFKPMWRLHTTGRQ